MSIPKLINDGLVTDELTEISEQFNNHFVKIGMTIANNDNKSDDSDFKTYLKHSISSTIVLDPPQPVEIFNVINSLNPHKASGYDNISAYFLRLGNEVFAPILTAYFTRAFEKEIFPCTFKTVKVVPIFKTSNKNSVNNYRPISLLPSLSKVLEKLIKNRFVKFFDKYDILRDYQYGLREGHSVLHSLLDVTSFGYDSIQNKENITMLLMDLRKTFDTVSHNILLQKLYHYGIRGPAHKLIESYLTSRKQFVSIDSVNSSAQSINIGVPQGSILGPLPFLIYINDLPNAISSKPRLFADDTCIMLNDSSLPNLETKCNTELNQLENWCNANKLQINQKKSNVLLIPSKLNSPPLNLKIYYDNSLIACQELCKYLGMNLDAQLLFKNYIKQIEVKVTKGVGCRYLKQTPFSVSQIHSSPSILCPCTSAFTICSPPVGLHISKIHTKTPTPSKQGHTGYLQ